MLDSIRGFRELGGEVVVVDTGSADNTAGIAESCGCRVYREGDRFRHVISEGQACKINEWAVVPGEGEVVKGGDALFDFAGARNYAAGLASNDWVWMPDCDEAFTKLDMEAVSGALGDAGLGRLEYNFVFSHDEFGRPRVKFRHSKLYNRTRLKWSGIVHEVLTPRGEAGGASKFMPEDKVLLEHWQNHGTNRDQYLKGLALDCWLNPDNDRNRHYFGRELFYKAKWRSAIGMLRSHVAMKKWPAERAQSLFLIGECYGRLGQDLSQDAHYFAAWLTEPRRRIGLFALMEKYYRKRDAAKVVKFYEMLKDIPYSGFYSDNMAHYTNLPEEYAYWAYWWTGDRKKSKECWERAAAYCPDCAKYREDAKWYVSGPAEGLPTVDIVIPTLGRFDGLCACIKSIQDMDYPKDKIRLFVQDGPATVPAKVNDMVSKGDGEYVCFLANDTVIKPDALRIAVRSPKALVSFNTGVDEAEHFIIKRSFIGRLEDGQLFHEDFNHVGCDNWLRAQAEKLGEYAKCDKAVVEHGHFSRPGNAHLKDEVYAKGWAKAEEDRQTLAAKLRGFDGGRIRGPGRPKQPGALHSRMVTHKLPLTRGRLKCYTPDTKERKIHAS